MKIHGKMGFADFQEDDIQLPGFYTNIPPSSMAPTGPMFLLNGSKMVLRMTLRLVALALFGRELKHI